MSQAVRLSAQQFEKEADAACLASFVLEKMRTAVDPGKNNAKVFSDEIIETCRTRYIEGLLDQDI